MNTHLIHAALLGLLTGALPAQSAPDATKPVQVYILAGQSNMVGMGDVSGARCRYTGIYLTADPNAPKGSMRIGRAEYKIAPLTLHGTSIATYGNGEARPDRPAKGRSPLPFGRAVGMLPQTKGMQRHVVRGMLEVSESGTFEVNPGFGTSANNVMKLAGKVVYSKREGDPAVRHPIALAVGKRYPFEITYATGGSTALWLSRLDLVGRGDLESVVKRDQKFPFLLDADGRWSVRNDVYFHEARIKFEGGPLTVRGRTIGPELGFGHVLGDHHDAHVLLIKTAMGNRALGFDFRPPASGRTAPDNKWESLEYRLMVEGVRKTLKDLAKIVPGYKGQGYEIAGFAWWQGHKDGGTEAGIAQYEQHLVNLIKDVRKEFGVPDMPAVVATVGFGGHAMAEKYVRILAAQMAVGDPEKHPEFAGTVRSVDIRDFWRGIDDSPRSQDYHYNRNAETYMLVGQALGRAMVALHEGKPAVAHASKSTATPPAASDAAAELVDATAAAHALRPIIEGSMIPQFIGRNRKALLADVAAERPARVSPFLRNATWGLTEYYRKAGIDEYDWRGFGPDLRNTAWDFFSFDPQEQQPKNNGKPRYRKVTYPDGQANWFATDFDAKANGWQRGMPPFGQVGGAIPKEPPRDCTAPYCRCGTPLRSLWTNEVLLVRNRFECPPLKPGHRYRFVIGGSAHVNCGEGYAIWVDGEQLVEVKSGVGKRQGGQPRGAFVDRDLASRLKGGPLTLAATSFLRYYHPRRKQIPAEGHFALWMEERKNPPLGHDAMWRSASTTPMTSSKWQASRADDDRFRHDGSFVDDASVLGSWKVVDQVPSIEAFTADRKRDPGRPPLQALTLRAGGATNEPLFVWTAGKLMNLDRNEALQIKTARVGESNYLFVEAGGFGDRKPQDWRSPWLVLERTVD